jgi:selenide,water dikinase
VLRHLVPVDDPAVMVDAATADDAAVYRLGADRALVVTADFFTPIVDDPHDFGRIAAANALSDVYAMGARPLFALNLVAFPRALLDRGILSEIVRGGGEVAREAGAAVLGGHSIEDPEPKYGLCVVGEVAPDAVIRNSTAVAGDVLVLTKPLGTGIVSTAIKAGHAPSDAVAAAVASMTTLNRTAAEVMVQLDAHACTDVTGYGLLGHVREMMSASGVSARITAGAVPLLPGVRPLVEQGHVPGGTKRNMEDLGDTVTWDDVDEVTRTLLVDAQTSGGLLISMPAAQAETLVSRIASATLQAGGGLGGADANLSTPVVVGVVEEGDPGRIRVV